MGNASRNLLLLVGSLSVLAACAQGSEIGTGGGGSGGNLGAGGSKSTVASSSHSTTGSVTSSSSSTTGSSSSSSSGSSTGSGMMCDFTAPNTCAAATGIPSISGDTGSDVRMMTGSSSEFLQIHVTEDDSSVFSKVSLSFTATLTSPPGTVYNLIIHEGSDGNGTDCNAPPMNGTPSGGATQTVSNSWSDTQGIGGIDNSRWLSIQIIHVSGNDCITPWNLKIQGHT